MSSSYKFEGYVAHGPDSAKGHMKWEEFRPKAWDENDVDIEVSHCGVCGGDIQTLRSEWGPSMYPVVVGHEIVGKAVRVGSNVDKRLQVGDVVAVGAQSDACMECEMCKRGEENHCQNGAGVVGTYNAKARDGGQQQGGYAKYARVPGRFCFKVPDGLPHASAAPMMCAGVTVYTPLVENGCGPGKTVGVVGMGGLGHFAVLFAKALGASRVVAISRKAEKRPDALKMGADEYVATDDDGWAKRHANTLDLIICTVASPKMPFREYLSMLRIRGQLTQVGVPSEMMPSFHAFDLVPKAAKIGGSMIGGRPQVEAMLALAARSKMVPWVQERPMDEANQALIDLDAGKARYRYVLTN